MYSVPASAISRHQVKSWAPGGGESKNIHYPFHAIINCPHCHANKVSFALTWQNHQRVDFFFTKVHCGNCGELVRFFLIDPPPSTVNWESVNNTGVYMMPEPKIGRSFEENIENLSPDFVEIYNQALRAGSLDMSQLRGLGYRKALEFLIKDYLIKHKYEGDAEKEEEIKGKFLGKCITQDVDDPRLKEAASKAIWLANDETHYVRKWEENIEQLEKLINLTLHWVGAELLTAEITATDTPGVAPNTN